MCYYCLVSIPYDNRWLAFREEELLPEMWFQFAFSLGVFLFVLALPGFCFFRLLETNRLHALLLSPAFSLTLYSGLGVLYGFAGIASSALTVFLIPCALLLACLALKRLRDVQRRKRGGAPTSCGDTTQLRQTRMSLLYLACGLFAGTILFLKPLDGAGSFVSTYDNLYHYNAVRALIESGYWSPLGTSCYLALPESMNPMPGGTYPLDGYYPIGWHILVALVMELSSCELPVAVNVVNFTFSSIVFPLGMYALMASLFKRKSTVAAGALCTCLCAIFPWYMLIDWPLFPNLAAFCQIPLLASCFICLAKGVSRRFALAGDKASGSKCSRKSAAVRQRRGGQAADAPKRQLGRQLEQRPERGQRGGGQAAGAPERRPERQPVAITAAGFLLACVACATMHPNSIFAAALFLAPFAVWIFAWTAGKRFGICAGALCGLAVAAIIALSWIALANADSFKYVMDEATAPKQLPDEAWQAVSSFSFMNDAGQPLLFVAAVIGSIALLIVRRKGWLIISFAIAVIAYVASSSFDEGVARQLLTGFWYSEPKRIGCIVGLTAMPLVACGVSAVYETLLLVVGKVKVARSAKDARMDAAQALNAHKDRAEQRADLASSASDNESLTDFHTGCTGRTSRADRCTSLPILPSRTTSCAPARVGRTGLRSGSTSCAPARVGRIVLAGVMGLSFALALFCIPGSSNTTSDQTEANLDGNVIQGSALQRIAQHAEKNYATSIPDHEETAFIERAKDEIGSDEGVINLPYDGSIIAYGLTGLKSYYLERYGYGKESETAESVLIRSHLSEIATNPDVLSAVRRTGCRYVLLLKQDKDIIYGFDESQWTGISSINDTTPGFTTILADGAMRLYRIDGV